MSRGALIVLEGCDKAGKSTQCKKLVASLPKAKLLNYPNRTTAIGSIINKYLKNEIELTDEAVHLLFSSNRWEAKNEIINSLKEGTTLIIDRYAYSGVAFTASKQEFRNRLSWCQKPDIGLPKPDKVFYLTLNQEDMKNRGDFGHERYEKTEFQQQVHVNFQKLRAMDEKFQGNEDLWSEIDAGRSIEEVFEELKSQCDLVMKKVENQEIGQLWSEQ